MNKHSLVEQTLDTIQRTAMKIASLPAAARDEALDVAHRAYANAMHDLGQDNVAAGRWVETVMTSVRLLVAEIDRDAAAGGGADAEVIRSKLHVQWSGNESHH
jgi:hypothetical protein